MRSVELFAGAGGLAMGVTLAGFDSLAVLEWNTPACDTVRKNIARGYPLVKDWPLWEGGASIRLVGYSRGSRFAGGRPSLSTLLHGWQAQGVS